MEISGNHIVFVQTNSMPMQTQWLPYSQKLILVKQRNKVHYKKEHFKIGDTAKFQNTSRVQTHMKW